MSRKPWLAIGWVLFAMGSLFAQEPPLKVYAFNVEPWFLHGVDEGFTGIAADQARLLAKEVGREIEFVELPWSRGLEYLKTGAIDVMPNLSRTPERESSIVFLGIMAQERNVVLVRKAFEGVAPKTLDGFTEKEDRWGIRQDTFYTAAFNARLEKDPDFRAHFEATPRALINLEKVRYGRLTGLIGDGIALRYFLQKDGSGGFKILETPLFPETPIYWGASRKMDPDHLLRLQEAFQRLQRKRAFEKIVKRWTGR